MKSPLSRLRPATLIPVVLIGAAVLVGGVSLLELQGNEDIDDQPPLTAAGSALLDRAAARLAEPGLYVAPAVPLSRFTGTQYDDINARLRAAAVPVRIAVLPASVTRTGQITTDRLTQLLRRRVAEPGVYTVLVDQRGADSPGAIEAFIAEVESPDAAFGSPLLWLALPALALAGVAWLLWRRRPEPDRLGPTASAEPEVIAALAGVLTQELTELAYRLAALPDEAPGNAQVAGRTAHAKYTLAKAKALSHRLARSHPAERNVVAVVGLIADARRTLQVIEELRLGHPPPSKKPPCFIDPRHGPSRIEGSYTPTGLLPRTVPVCATCAAELAAGQRPAVRLLPHTALDGSPGWANYWEAAGGQAYVEGYWGEFSFPDEEVEAGRSAPAKPPPPDPVDLLRLRLRTDQE